MAFKKKTQIAILGGGLTGLIVAARLEKAGLDYLLIEAQDFGGLVKGQHVNGASLDFGLKSIPLLGALEENPLVQLKKDLNLNFQIESFNESAQYFENKTFSEFVGFGETKNRALVEELNYYLLSPRLMVAGGWRILVDELQALIPEKKRLPNSHITRLGVQDERVTTVLINGESSVTAENFIFTFSPGHLKEILGLGVLSGKTLQKIARTEPFTAISLDIATVETKSSAKNIFLLSDYSKASEVETFVLGQFVSNGDPSRAWGGCQVSTWMTLVDHETLLSDEDGSKAIKNMKKIVTKAFPDLIANTKWERLLVIPEAFGAFNQLTLEKNGTLPGLNNLWLCGGRVQSSKNRNLGTALDSAKAVSDTVTGEYQIKEAQRPAETLEASI
jgi:phytoene dehydrogenase-like protein